jgi:hypothetical protein
MAAERQLATAAQRQAADRRRHWLARCFELAERAAYRRKLVQCDSFAVVARRAHDQVISHAQFAQIGADAKCRCLS